jgi:glycosyltransferase involved in cell wall biosynthesis
MTVTVIVPNYNHAKYLKQRIDSVLNQTYRDFELIILDDCSTDNSREIIDDYTSRFPYITTCFNTCNSGSPFIQWDFGVNKAKGEFIWIAESDDYADPRFLEKTSAIMLNNENVGLVYCNSRVIDEQKKTEYLASKWKAHLHSSKWLKSYINNGKDELSDYLFNHNTINNVSSVLFRKNKYIEAGYANHSMKFCGDWFLYIRILLLSDVAYISEPLNNLRLHSNSTIQYYSSSNKYIIEVIRVYSFVIKHIRLTPKNKFLMANNLLLLIFRRLLHSIRILLTKGQTANHTFQTSNQSL